MDKQYKLADTAVVTEDKVGVKVAVGFLTICLLALTVASGALNKSESLRAGIGIHSSSPADGSSIFAGKEGIIAVLSLSASNKKPLHLTRLQLAVQMRNYERASLARISLKDMEGNSIAALYNVSLDKEEEYLTFDFDENPVKLEPADTYLLTVEAVSVLRSVNEDGRRPEIRVGITDRAEFKEKGVRLSVQGSRLGGWILIYGGNFY